MRRITRSFGAVALLSLLVSCEARFDWPWLEKKPSAPVRAAASGGGQERSVEGFQRVVLEGVGRLVFDSDVPAGTIQIQAEPEVLPQIQTSVSAGTLTITQDGVQGPGNWDLEFRLAPPNDLAEITLGGLGTIETVAPIRTTRPLNVTIQGMGKVDLDVDAPTVIAHQNGSGELVLRGKAGTVQILAQGLGKVDAQELVTAEADVQSQGVGEVLVYASEKLKVRAQGLGAVHFYGNPATTDVQTEGLTQVSAGE